MSGILLALSFLAGLLLHDSHGGWILAAPVALAALLLLASSRTYPQRALILLCLAGVGLGAMRAQSTEHPPSGTIVVPFNDVDRSIVATVDGLPRDSANRTHANLRFAGSNSDVTASMPVLPVIADGDIVRFSAPRGWRSPSAGNVEVPLDSAGELFVPSLEIIGADAPVISRERTRLTDYLTNTIHSYVPEPAGALTLGIMTGDDTGMTSATRAAFRAAGLSHITAVSGWNVAVLTGLIIVLLRRFAPSRGSATVVAIVAIWCYAFVVGMQPSVVRAAGMGTVFLIARLRGRPGDLLTSLLMTSAVIVAITPEIRFDIGFQLSVAATLGIVLLIEASDDMSLLRETFALPVVAELSIAPLLLHHFGSYSVLAIVANVITAPLVVAVMWFGILTVGVAWLNPWLAGFVGTLAWIPARLIVAIAEKTASFSWASSKTVTLSWSTTLILYGLLLGGYLAWVRWHDQWREQTLVGEGANRI